jgi:hypothetical protein
METSHYKEYIDEFSPQLLPGIVEKLNGSLEQPNYLYKQDLTPEFSVSGQWQAQSYSGVLVEADFVSMDSPLPLKRRDSFGSTGGAIPKSGTQRNLNEQELTDIQTMIALNTPRTNIALKLFQDTKFVIGSMFERYESAYLQGLSTGVALIDDDMNVGSGIRVDYKYLNENKFGVSVLWSNTASKPMTDIANKILAKASLDGKRVVKVRVDLATLQNILKTDEAKDMFAVSVGNFGSVRPIPNLQRLNDAVLAEYGYYFEKVDRTITRERDGNRTTYKPWAAGAVVAQTTENVGSLQYARLAEDASRVAGVDYQKVEDYMLVSKFRTNQPSLAEFTRAQARVIPVISETVYLMDSTTVQA